MNDFYDATRGNPGNPGDGAKQSRQGHAYSHSDRAEQSRANQTYYDDFSQRYDFGRAAGYHALIDELEVRSVAEYVRGKDVLEAGCGTGLILQRLNPLARSVHGIDLSHGMLRHAAERGFGVAQASVTELPFDDASFDVVCSFKVLPHVANIEEAVGELVRVTKPGGWLALEFYNPWSVRFVAKKLAGPRAISRERDESNVFTRFDGPSAVKRLVAPYATRIEFRGVRIFTPFASIHRLPLIAPAARALESWSVDSPMWRFGSFLIVLFERR